MIMMATCFILAAMPTVSMFQLQMNASHLRSQFSSTTLCLKSHFSFKTSRSFQLLASPFMTYSLANVVMPCYFCINPWGAKLRLAALQFPAQAGPPIMPM